MRKSLWTVALLVCAGNLSAPEARAEEYTCEVVGGNQAYLLDIEDSYAYFYVNGVEYDGYGSLDEEFGMGDYSFSKTVPIGDHALPTPELRFRLDMTGDSGLHGT